jgi:rhomboid protease GluP
MAMVGLNVAVFLVMCLSGVSVLDPAPLDLVTWGGLFGPLTIGHQWWRIGTAMFLHVGIIHLVMNMLCLVSLGPVVEGFFDRGVFLLTYFLSGLGGSLVSLLVHPDVVGAGASGAIFGTAGALFVSSAVYARTGIPKPLKAQANRLVSFLAINLIYGFVEKGIDVAAHLGGMLTGAILGLVLLTPGAIGGATSSRKFVGVAAGGILGIVLAAAGLQRWRGPSPAEYSAALREVAEARRLSERQERQDQTAKDAATKAGHDATNREERTTELEEVLKRGTGSSGDFLELGTLYAGGGKTEEAVRTFQDGLVRQPQDSGLLNALGTLAYNLGQFETSVDAYSRLLALGPGNSEVQTNLQAAYLGRAHLRKKVGQLAESRADYQRVLDLGVQSEWAVEARRALDSLKASQ